MKLIYISFLLLSIAVKSQTVRPLMGIGYNRHSQFYNSSYYNFSTGFELNLKKHIKPEIEVNCFLGGIGDVVNYSDQNIAIDVFSSNFSVVNFGFIPKIILFKEEDEFYYFQILPKYNFSKIEAKGDYLLINQNDATKSIREKETLKESKQSFGLGFGIVFNLSKTEKSDAIAFNLLYQHIDSGSLIIDLKHNNSVINTKDVFSFEVDYYFNLSKKKK